MNFKALVAVRFDRTAWRFLFRTALSSSVKIEGSDPTV